MSSLYLIIGPSADHHSVEAWSLERLPFEPKDWKRQLRSDIREALQKLSFIPDYYLATLYISPVDQYCDVENIVFYNVGSTYFTRLARHGIRFERVFSQPPTPPNSAANGWRHYLSYALINKEIGFTYWEPICLLAKWEYLPCGMLTSSSKVASVWYWFKLGIGAGRVQRLVRSEGVHAKLGLKVTIHVSRSAGINLTSVIKPVFDGIVAAFNRHDGSDMNLVAKRLATDLSIDQKEVICLSEDETMAILGTRRLIWPRGSGVQWNPSDNLLVAGELSLVDHVSKPEWELSGELFEVRETKSGTHLL